VGADVLEALAVLTAAPGRFWAHVSDDGLGGHVLASHFHHAPALWAAAYWPTVFVVHAYRLGLAYVAAELVHVDAQRGVGVPLVRALGAALQDLLQTMRAPEPVLAELAAHMRACESLAQTNKHLAALGRALDVELGQRYRRAAATTGPQLPAALTPPEVPGAWERLAMVSGVQ
jgi:hypothetical protein